MEYGRMRDVVRVVLYVAGSLRQVVICDVRAHQASRLADLAGRRVASAAVQLDDYSVRVQRRAAATC